jgi:hypothetical protein
VVARPTSLAHLYRHLEQIEILLEGIASLDDRPLRDIVAGFDLDSRSLVADTPHHVRRICELLDQVGSGTVSPAILSQLTAETQLAVHGLVTLLMTLQLTDSEANHR